MAKLKRITNAAEKRSPLGVGISVVAVDVVRASVGTALLLMLPLAVVRTSRPREGEVRVSLTRP